MREFAKEVADDQLGVDAKLPRTLKALFFKPGFLTREYMAGRIVRYIPPFRLYLIFSVLFFVVLSFLSNQWNWAEKAASEMREGQDSIVAARADTTAADSARAGDGLKFGVTVKGERWIDSVRAETGWDWLDQKVKRNLQELGDLPAEVALRRMLSAFLNELPKVMFIMLPVYAFLLKLLYIRRKRYYVEHFIFALHVHAFVFALFTLSFIIGADWTISAITIIFLIYTYIAMKTVYQQGHGKTFVKWLTLGSAYMIVLTIGVLIALISALAGPVTT